MKSGTNYRQFGFAGFCGACLMIIPMMLLEVDGFAPLDDHNFVGTLMQGKSFGAYIFPELGRFFPLTAQEYVLAAKIVAPSPQLFYAISAIKLIVSGVLLFRCLMLTGASRWAVTSLWCVVVFSIGFANVAFRLHAGESSVLLLVLLFVWSTLAIERDRFQSPMTRRLTIVCGLLALATAMFYKELVFIFALSFGTAEIVRIRRNKRIALPRRLRGLLIIGTAYIVGYGIWRAIYTSGSYMDFHALSIWDAARRYAVNDSFMILILLPLVVFRAWAVLRNPDEQTIFDSFLAAAGCYTLLHLVLGMYNTYYLLPAYAFAVCGVGGILVAQSSRLFRRLVLGLSSVFAANAAPVALADAAATRTIINNHHDFVHEMAEWLWANPMAGAEPRSDWWRASALAVVSKYLSLREIPDRTGCGGGIVRVENAGAV